MNKEAVSDQARPGKIFPRRAGEVKRPRGQAAGALARLSLCVFSAVLLILSFPNFELSFFAWFALAPLFFAVRNKKHAYAFFLGFITGAVFYIGSMYWLYHVTLPGLILLSSYMALYFGFFALFSNYALRDARRAMFVVPAAWVALEFVRATALTGIGWSLLGYSQYKNLPFIQIADITGAYGVSFLIVMVNVAIYRVIGGQAVNPSAGSAPLAEGPRSSFDVAAEGGLAQDSPERSRGAKPRGRPDGQAAKSLDHSSAWPLFICFLCVAATLGYGRYKLFQHESGQALRVSIIQGNIPQEKKWDPNYQNYIFDRYAILSKVASSDEPELIAWPETALPGYFESEEDQALTERLKALAGEIKIPILLGAPLYRIGDASGFDSSASTGTPEDSAGSAPVAATYYFNSAVLLNAAGETVKRYDKLRLVPFGEYIPFEKYLGFIHNFAPYPIAGFTPGGDYTVFDLSTVTHKQSAAFSVLICFEDIFPALSRRFVREGARFLVNISNDAWYKISPGPYQHAQASVFRAVENRVNVVRATNTGFSCFIGPNGEILSSVRNKKGKEIWIEGFASQDIKIQTQKSFYTSFGDIFAYLCIVVSVITAMFRVIP